MTTTSLSASSLLAAVVHGEALGGLVAAVVLRAVTEPWAITAAWSLLGAVTGAVVRLLLVIL